MKVHLTGGDGYLGGWVRALLHGHELVAAEDAEAVVHLAWRGRTGDLDPGAQRQSLRDTQGLLARCAGARLFVFASTLSVHGDRGEEWVDVDTPAAPNCAYTRAKVEAEQAVRRAFPGDRHLILRLGSLMGKGTTRTRHDLVVNAFAAGASEHGRIEVWNPSCWKPVIHVRDAADFVVKSLTCGRTGTVTLASNALRASTIASIAANRARRLGGAVEVVEVESPNGRRSCRAVCPDVPGWRTVAQTVAEFT